MKKSALIIAIAVISMSIGKAQTASKEDSKFAMCTAKASMMEVKLGQLAQTNGTSESVKMLGRHMVEDHTKANDDLKALAAKKSINLPADIDEKQQKSYNKLAEKHGKDFDKAYTKCMVKDHKKVICEFKKEAKKGTDPDLKSWANATIPTLEHHEEMSKETCKSVKEGK